MRSGVLVILGVLTSACGAPAESPPVSPPTIAPPPSTSPSPPASVTPGPTAQPAPVLPTCVHTENPVYESTLVGDDLQLCFLEGDHVDCWSYSLTANTWTPHGRRPDVPKPVVAAVTVSGSTITACKPDRSDCRAIPFVPALQADEVAEVSASSDRSLVALSIGGGPIRVLDAAGKQVSVINGWPTAMSERGKPAFFRHTKFVGPALAAAIADTPVTSAIRLFDPRTGKKLGEIGGGKPMSDTIEPVELGAGQYAFVEFDTSAIVVHDVATGRLVRRYKIPGVEAAGYSLLVKAPDGKSLLGVQGAALYRLELATGKVARFAAPVCPS